MNPAVLAALLAAGTPAFTLPDVLAFATIRELAVSPDSRQAAIAVRRGDLDAAAFVTNIWLVDIAGDAPARRLTFGEGGASNLRWSPSGTEIGFIARRGDRAQVWALAATGGEARPLTDHGEAVAAFEWAPEGRRLLFLGPAPETDDEARRRKTKDDARVDGAQWRRHRLWIVPTSGGRPEAVTDGTWHVVQATWAPDGARIALVTRPTPEADSSLEARLQVLDLRTGVLQDVGGGDGAADPRWSPDGGTLAFLRPFDGHELSRADAFVWKPGMVRARAVSAALDRDAEKVRWAAKDGALDVHYAVGASSGIARIDVASAGVEPLWMPGRPLLLAETAGAGWSFVPGDAPAEVWVAGAGGEAPRQRTGLNDTLADRARPRLEAVRWRSGASEVEGVLAHPTTPAAGRRPLLVIPHGGPRDHSAAVFDPQTAYFTSLGYLVLRPNFRGSTGYGDAFARANVGDWGTGPFQDVMTGVDALIERGLADPRRLFLYGWSYGGYLANWAVTHTDRFRAVASGAGVADLRMQYVLSDARRWRFDYFAGSPFAGHHDLYARESPITYVGTAKAPTLFLHGEADTRVPLAQGIMMYRGLRDAGVETELVVYPREGHSFEEPRHVLDRLQRIADWFARHDARPR